MPTAKLNVATLLDHGPLGAATLTRPLPETEVAQPLLPGDAAEAVMKSQKRVIAGDRRFADVAKLFVVARDYAGFAKISIQARYDLLGGAGGFLGAPAGVVTACPDGVGFFQHFAGGSIYWHPQTGAHEVHGLIRAKWAAMGWERSFLGYPRTDETKGGDSRHEGRFNHFQGGSIHWHPATGAFEVHGAIRAKYLELGAEASFLGYPTTDETATPDRVGRFNHFQGGSIYWTPSTGAHEVHGLIRAKWASLGWERNAALGYPVTDELVPHRGVGHTRPPSIRKPGLALPLDVIRAPDEQPSPTIAAAVASRPVLFTASPALMTAGMVAPAAPAAAAPAIRANRAGVAISRAEMAGAVLAVRPELINPVANHKGQSQDRYGDFENGVLFWRRGTNEAIQLSPRATAPGGATMAWTGGGIANLAAPHIRGAFGSIPGANIAGISFSGTTSYSWDGAGLHNRAHRVRVTLQGLMQSGMIPVPATAIVEVAVEINFDPVDREIVGYLTRWSLLSSMGDFIGGGSLRRVLHQRLDAALWRQFLVAQVPGTADDPIAVLSVKTQADGRVAVYFEP